MGSCFQGKKEYSCHSSNNSFKKIVLDFHPQSFFLKSPGETFLIWIGDGSKTSIGGSLGEHASRSDRKVARTNPSITLPETTSLPLKINETER